MDERFTSQFHEGIYIVSDGEDGGSWTAKFWHEFDAQAYCDFRNNPTPAPKFAVGDRVRWTNGRDYEIAAVETYYRATRHGTTGGELFPETGLELAPPEPPKVRWEVGRDGTYWTVTKGSEQFLTHSEALAIQVRDLLNAQDEAAG